MSKNSFALLGERVKVSQRGLGGFPHERLALAQALATQERHPEGVKGKGFFLIPFTFPPVSELAELYPFPDFCKKFNLR